MERVKHYECSDSLHMLCLVTTIEGTKCLQRGLKFGVTTSFTFSVLYSSHTLGKVECRRFYLMKVQTKFINVHQVASLLSWKRMTQKQTL